MFTTVQDDQLLDSNISLPFINSLKTVQKYCITMARLAVAACCAICLYFLLVCVVTGHSSVLLRGHDQKTFGSESSSFRYETSGDIAQAQELINQMLAKKAAIETDNSEVIQTTSKPSKAKLERLLQANNNNKPNPSDHHRYSVMDHDNVNVNLVETYSDCTYHLAFTLIDQTSKTNHFTLKLMNKFSNTLSSILINLNSTNLDQGALCIHMITDGSIRPYINDVIVRVHEDLVRQSSLYNYNNFHHHHQHGSVTQDSDNTISRHRPLTKYFFIDTATIESKLEKLLPTLRTYFTHKPNSYYSNALFFYSMVLHQVIPRQVADRLILLDVDVQLDANLLELFEEFGRFQPTQVMGIAHEQQPVYRHILNEYRHSNENTTAGSPPPTGFPGYNSGVLLLHLRKMRESFLYNSLLNDVLITHLCRKYRFRGHLGDQDFYTVAAIDYPQLFYTLPCGWNRQLCQWWRFHGYGPVFDDYHRCSESIKLYHGNCNSVLPTLTSYGEYRRKRR
ncbi:Xyloside xylosyltransferase 1 [Blomia tropicalis]|nr:Xyloside xylosyltransferase 1 [Blomia tropicalis]